MIEAKELEVSDRDLEAMVAKEKGDEDEIEIYKGIIPVSVNKFWSMFLEDECTYSFEQYFKDEGETELETTKWEPMGEEGKEEAQEEEQAKPEEENKAAVEEDEVIEGAVEEKKEDGIFKPIQRKINMRKNLQGVPFMSSAMCYKTQMITHKTDTRLVIYCENRTPDVPYGDCFFVCDRWIVTSPFPNAERSMLIAYGKVTMVKSTMFKGRITTKSHEGIIQYMKDWVAMVTKKGHFDMSKGKPKKQQTLSHDVEKVDENENDQEEKKEPPSSYPQMAWDAFDSLKSRWGKGKRNLQTPIPTYLVLILILILFYILKVMWDLQVEV